MKEPTANRVRQLLRYEPETGVLRWQHARGNRAAGSVAGSPSKQADYIDVGIDGGLYRAHRVIWALVTGAWPSHDIDHRDTVRSNNRWSNLRLAPDAVNAQNERRARVQNGSGLLGVSRKAGRLTRPWQAQIRIDGKQVHLGYFDDQAQAHSAYVAAKRRHHEGCTL